MEDAAVARPAEGPKVLVGLGNPGPRYIDTRHNFGFAAVDRIGSVAGARWSASLETCMVAEARLEGRAVLLAKPVIYMNRSGRALQEVLAVTGASAADVLVFYDDIALPLGVIRIRERGGSGGHLGLESILQAMGRQEIPRVRLGIHPPAEQGEPDDVAEFVLERFSADERPIVEEVLDRAVAATRAILREGTAKAMSLYNAAPA